MTIPSTAAKFPAIMDPHEELDWRVPFETILEDGEAVAVGAWVLETLPEAAALGLTIMTGSGRDPELTVDGRGLLFWATIDPAFQDNAAFDDAVVYLPLRVTFPTDALPARKRQRTFLIGVSQQ